LAHEEKLARVAESSGGNAAFFEAAVLLNDGNVPAIEFPHLRIAFFHNLFAARNVEKARAFTPSVEDPPRERRKPVIRLTTHEVTTRKTLNLIELRTSAKMFRQSMAANLQRLQAPSLTAAPALLD